MKDATVAIEDSRFYKHKGVDFEGVIRAAFKNLQNHHDVQGGSTLTMQLIRNLYTGERQRTFSRKIKEAKLAEDLGFRFRWSDAWWGPVTWLAAVYVERGGSGPDSANLIALFGTVTVVGTAVMPLGADRIGTRRGQLVASSPGLFPAPLSTAAFSAACTARETKRPRR
jgi:hypothetical protein